VLWTWTFPAISADVKSAINTKTSLQGHADGEQITEKRVFGRVNDVWYYIYTAPVEALQNATASFVSPTGF
jgi:hypothetical protein